MLPLWAQQSLASSLVHVGHEGCSSHMGLRSEVALLTSLFSLFLSLLVLPQPQHMMVKRIADALTVRIYTSRGQATSMKVLKFALQCVNKCLFLCALCECLRSTLFVILMKGSGRARVKRDACWHGWGSGRERYWPQEAYEDKERRKMEERECTESWSRQNEQCGGERLIREVPRGSSDGSICLLV